MRPQELNLDWCTAVPATVWQKLGHGVDFQQLTRASFVECLREHKILQLLGLALRVVQRALSVLLAHPKNLEICFCEVFQPRVQGR